MAVWIFFLCSPDCPKQPRIDNSFYRFLNPMICGTISGDESLGKPLTLAVSCVSQKTFLFQKNDVLSGITVTDITFHKVIYVCGT